MSQNAAPGQQQNSYRRHTTIMLLPNYSIVEKSKQLSKFNQPKNDQNFHCMTRNEDQLRAKPHLLPWAAFSLSIELCSVSPSRSEVHALRQPPSWGTAEKNTFWKSHASLKRRHLSRSEEAFFFPLSYSRTLKRRQLVALLHKEMDQSVSISVSLSSAI